MTIFFCSTKKTETRLSTVLNGLNPSETSGFDAIAKIRSDENWQANEEAERETLDCGCVFRTFRTEKFRESS
jgi:hypothetical protein